MITAANRAYQLMIKLKWLLFPFTDGLTVRDNKNERKFVSFLIDVASKGRSYDYLYWTIKDFVNQSAERKRKLLPGFYLFIEPHIIPSGKDPIDFRENLYRRFNNAIDADESLKLIFLSPEKQTLSLVKRFLTCITEKSRCTVGPDQNLTDDDLENLVRISHDIFHALKKQHGEQHAIEIFNQVYEQESAVYHRLNTFSYLLKLFPDCAIDESKYDSLSPHQLKNLLIDKIKGLELLSEELREKNSRTEQQFDVLSERNDQITLQNTLIEMMNDELNSHSKNLEAKVEERTRELAHSNKLLRHYNDNLELFTFTISHKLKAPISRLMGLTHLLRIVPANEHAAMMESVHGAATELDALFTDLVHSVNLKRDIAEVKKERVDVQSLLYEIWTQLQKDEEKPAFKCSIKNSSIIKTDKARLAEALGLILDNSLKFAGSEGGAQIKAVVSTEEDKMTIIIEDTGVGFDASDAGTKLFAPFSRFNQTYPGRGMGLYLTRQHVLILGGDIQLESAINKGTKIKIELPLNHSESAGHFTKILPQSW